NASPKAVLGLLREIQDQISAPIPVEELVEEAEAWERGVDELARTDEDVAEYVRRLERAQDASELPEASGDASAKEIEQFLRRRLARDLGLFRALPGRAANLAVGPRRGS